MSVGMTLAAGVAVLSTQPVAATPGVFPLIELRQYTLHEGQRDTLIDLFEREFVESQEAVGMKVIGTFRDLDRPNRFVWVRGFKDMDARLAGLTSFYDGSLWKSHRDAANATIIDNDNVLLLRAPSAAAVFKAARARPSLGESAPAGLIIATIYYLNTQPADALRLFESRVKPELERSDVEPLAWFVPETAPNNFRLPVREGERVLVWFARFTDAADHAAHKPIFDKSAALLAPFFAKPPEVLRLEPTSRSELR